MTINSPAADRSGPCTSPRPRSRACAPTQLRGTIQNDILKEYIAQKEYIFPPEPSMRLVVDTIEFGSRNVPQWNTISISGYHIREAGATAAQELAFTLADGMDYVRWGMARGLDGRRVRAAAVVLLQRPQRLLRGDRQVPRRAAHLGARDARDLRRAETRARGCCASTPRPRACSLTAQQPENNIVRVAHPGAGRGAGRHADPAHQLDGRGAGPALASRRPPIALRTQQIIADEIRRGQHRRPAGRLVLRRGADQPHGSAGHVTTSRRIDDLGGVLPAIESGFFQQEIAEAAYRYQREIDETQRVIVGVNDYADDQPAAHPAPGDGPAGLERQVDAAGERCAPSATTGAVGQALDRLRIAARAPRTLCRTSSNACAPMPRWARSSRVLRGVFGTYREPSWV